MHLTREVMDKLFGSGSELRVYRDLLQRGEFASEQSVEMIGPKGKFASVRILGPLRARMQVEISRTDAYHLGINPPVGKFAALPEGEVITLKGPAGSVTLTENIMISRRHIHINPEQAAEIGVKDQDTVFVAPAEQGDGDSAESRIMIMGNVLIRVKDTFLAQLHIDTDEANAAGLKSGDSVFVVQSSLGLYTEMPSKRLITENDVRQAIARKQRIRIKSETIVTPAARDLGKDKNVFAKG
ncbi:hypothetical protein GF407_10585 [candidate division KSB1 bacterium]|nr:hypothetical protein [candidate division KSB1 bacterium]